MEKLFFFSFSNLLFLTFLFYLKNKLTLFYKSVIVIFNSILLSVSLFFISYYYSLLFFLMIFGAFLVILVYILVLTSNEKMKMSGFFFFFILAIFYFFNLIEFSYDWVMNSKKEYLLTYISMSSVCFCLFFLLICLFVVKTVDISRYSSLRKFF